MRRTLLSFTSAVGVSARLALPLASLLVWAAVAFSAVTWALRWSATGVSPSQNAAVSYTVPLVDTAAAARILGAVSVPAPAAPTLASRFQLQGVMAGDASQGAALISVDGKNAKPFRVGALVADNLMLQSAQGRRVSLGATLDGPATLALELPLKK